MKRILHLEFTPSESLSALSSLRARSQLGATGFGARFDGEVAEAWRALEAALDLPARCVEWLWQRGYVRGAAPSRGAPRWLSRLTVHVPLRALDPRLDGERDPLRGPAHTTLFALRALLRTLHAHPWFTVTALRLGKTPARLAATLRAVEADARARGLSDDAVPSRLTRARPSPEAKANDTPSTDATAGDETSQAAAKTSSRRTQRAKAEAPTSAPTTEARESTAKAGATKTRTTKGRATKRPAPGEGFGGLPDDAVSEDRTAAASLSARGLTVDAEFFLSEAKIEAWPCASAVLDRARKVLLLQLHPDRAGEASTTSFHRAIKGYEELRARLPVDAPPAPVAASSAAPTASAARAPVPPAPTPPVPPPRAPVAKPVAPPPVAKPTAAATSPTAPRTPTAPVAPPPAAPVTKPRVTARPSSRGEWPPPPAP